MSSGAKYGVECNNGLASHVTCPDGRKLYCDNNAILVATELNRLASERDAALSDIANAVKCAKEYCPDYPWTLNTASEAVWATGEAFAGVSRACDDLVSERESLAAQQDAAVEACREAIKVADAEGGPLEADGASRAVAPLREYLNEATPTPAPTVNAELLEALREISGQASLVRQNDHKSDLFERIERWERLADAAIAKAEKSN